jgi:hypothetical protein
LEAYGLCLLAWPLVMFYIPKENMEDKPTRDVIAATVLMIVMQSIALFGGWLIHLFM